MNKNKNKNKNVLRDVSSTKIKPFIHQYFGIYYSTTDLTSFMTRHVHICNTKNTILQLIIFAKTCLTKSKL